MNENGTLYRRDVLQIAAAFGTMSAFAPVRLALAQSALHRTPDQILGPFYPAMKTADEGGDLTHVPGGAGRASGQVLNVMGRVLTSKDIPFPAPSSRFGKPTPTGGIRIRLIGTRRRSTQTLPCGRDRTRTPN